MPDAISVIVPAFNSEETILHAIDSVAAQEGGLPGIEIVVVDDASGDRTVAMVKGARLKVEGGEGFRMRLIEMGENRGPAAARNKGIADAKGEWIAFLDADDAWLSHKLETQLDVAKENPDVGMICGLTVPLLEEGMNHGGTEGRRRKKGSREWLNRWNASTIPETLHREASEGRVGGEKEQGEVATKRHEKAQKRAQENSNNQEPRTTNANSLPPTTQQPNPCSRLSGVTAGRSNSTTALEELSLDVFALRNPVATSTVLVKKSVLEEVGGFDESFRGPEDYDLWMRIAAQAKILRVMEPLAMYRDRAGSLSMDDRTFLPEVLRVIEKAFSAGGALESMVHLRPAAESGQYWNAAWMAFSRGDRTDALKYLVRAYRFNRRSSRRVDRPWFRMCLRYAVGELRT